MIAGAADGRCYRPGEAQIDTVQAVNKGIDDADEAIRCNIIINAGGEQARLGSVSSFDEAHSIAPISGRHTFTVGEGDGSVPIDLESFRREFRQYGRYKEPDDRRTTRYSQRIQPKRPFRRSPCRCSRELVAELP
jgi:hypothetical protein